MSFWESINKIIEILHIQLFVTACAGAVFLALYFRKQWKWILLFAALGGFAWLWRWASAAYSARYYSIFLIPAAMLTAGGMIVLARGAVHFIPAAKEKKTKILRILLIVFALLAIAGSILKTFRIPPQDAVLLAVCKTLRETAKEEDVLLTDMEQGARIRYYSGIRRIFVLDELWGKDSAQFRSFVNGFSPSGAPVWFLTRNHPGEACKTMNLQLVERGFANRKKTKSLYLFRYLPPAKNGKTLNLDAAQLRTWKLDASIKQKSASRFDKATGRMQILEFGETKFQSPYIQVTEPCSVSFTLRPQGSLWLEIFAIRKNPENGVAEGTHIGRISNIADTRPIRYTVPLVWDKNSAGTVALCLNFMHANFAVEQIEISASEQEK